jgi:hypothetical protein
MKTTLFISLISHFYFLISQEDSSACKNKNGEENDEN